MFERYTERARRVLFFARYEASQLGSISIETEHLLLGLIREGKGLTSRIFARSHLSLESISVYTNKTPTGSFRAPAGPQAPATVLSRAGLSGSEKSRLKASRITCLPLAPERSLGL